MPLCKPLWIVPVAQKQRKLAHNITLGKAAVSCCCKLLMGHAWILCHRTSAVWKHAPCRPWPQALTLISHGTNAVLPGMCAGPPAVQQPAAGLSLCWLLRRAERRVCVWHRQRALHRDGHRGGSVGQPGELATVHFLGHASVPDMGSSTCLLLQALCATGKRHAPCKKHHESWLTGFSCAPLLSAQDRDSTHTEASTVASAAAAAAASPAPGPPPRTSASGRGTLYTSALQRAHRASNPGNGSIAAANIPGLTINTGVSTNPTGNSGPPTATAATVAINNPLAGPTQPPPARRSAPGLPQLQAPSPFATNSLNPLIVQHGDGEHEEDEDHTSLHGGSQPGPNLAAQHSVAQESSLVEGPDRGSDHSSSSTPAMAANTVGRHIERSSTVVDGPGPGRIQLFRGLRVRIGVHTGACRVQLEPSHWS